MSQRELLERAASATCRRAATSFRSCRCAHNIELGAVVAGRDIADLPARIEAALDRFPVLRQKAAQQASTLSGGEQKQLEIARGLLLDPQLMLIDEPSIGLSPLMVQQTFDILKELRDRGVSILMIEQNARSALEISDYGIVLELGQTRLVDTARPRAERSPHRAIVPRRRDGGDRRLVALQRSTPRPAFPDRCRSRRP